MKKCFLFVIFAILSLFLLAGAAPNTFDDIEINNLIETPVRYDGAQLWRINFTDDVNGKFIESLNEETDVEIWSSSYTAVDVFLKQSAIDKVRQVLEDNNLQYSVQIEDVQKLIELEAQPLDVNAQKYSDHPLTWTNYHSTEDIYKFLDYLVAKYPDLCSLQTIGNTFENRELKVLKISNGNSGNKAIWIDGGIHAREWVSPASVTYIVNDLVENWDSQPEHIKNVNWYVLPVHNPDGYEYSRSTARLWRKNRNNERPSPCRGIDLNRNYGYKWGGKGTSDSLCSEIYRGSKPFSELESKAVKDFFESTDEQFEAFLTFHSYGQYILHPWGYDAELPEDHEDLAHVGNEGAKNIKALHNQEYSVGSSAILLYPAAGGSDDWAKSIGVKYSYTVELRDTGRYGFVLPPQYIVPTAQEAQAFVFTVAKAIAN